MVTAISKLEALMKRAGIHTQVELAKRCGYKTASGVQRLFEDRDKQYFSHLAVKKLSNALLGRGSPPITEDDLLGLAEPIAPAAEAITPIPRLKIAQSANSPYPLNLHDLVPLYGAAAGASPEIVRVTEEYMIGEVPRHPAIFNVKGGFAMLVYGDSMAPRINHGERVYVHPFNPPIINKACIVVQEPDGDAMVKVFRGEAGDSWKFSQYNPPKEFTIKKSKVRNIYAVVSVEW